VKRQGLHALLPLNGVNPNHRSLAGKFDGCDNRIELGHVETSIELFSRLPILDEQQGLAFVKIRIESGVKATWRDPRWSKHGSKRTQQSCSPFIGCHDLHRENDQDPRLSIVACKEKKNSPSCRKKRANALGARAGPETFDGSAG
jgi:hypothetical protein